MIDINEINYKYFFIKELNLIKGKLRCISLFNFKF